MYTLQFDGLFRTLTDDPGISRRSGFLCYGWLVLHNGLLIARGHGGYARCKDATSIAAEYMALIEGLEALGDLGVRNEAVEVIGDAKSIIEQMLGNSSVNSPHIKAYYRKARKLARQFTNLVWNWMPRKFNRHADALTRRAMRQIRMNPDCYQTALDALLPGKKMKSRSTRYVPLVDLRVYHPAGMVHL
jgi:ribonuclease HI